MRVLMVEDHDVVVTGVSEILKQHAVQIRVHRTAVGLVDEYLRIRPDVVLLDLNIPPDGNALTMIPRIMTADPTARVVCFSAAHDIPVVRAALDAGCAGYISKVADATEIYSLLELAIEGVLALDRRTAARLVQAPRAVNELTRRELDVLALVATGHTNIKVAERLHISRTAVTDALSSCYRKLRVDDRASAVRIAMSRDLIPELNSTR
jgi:two-component system invasion response regulator UvrY